MLAIAAQTANELAKHFFEETHEHPGGNIG